jgi:hypothetical protein
MYLTYVTKFGSHPKTKEFNTYGIGQPENELPGCVKRIRIKNEIKYLYLFLIIIYKFLHDRYKNVRNIYTLWEAASNFISVLYPHRLSLNISINLLPRISEDG